MGKYQVLYFPIRGRAEAIRIMLIDNGIEFDDISCVEGWHEKWRPSTPFGQLPGLVDGNFKLYQTNAIMRYLGKKHGLAGTTDEDTAKIDMLNEAVTELKNKYISMIYSSDFDKERKDFVEALSGKLKPIETLLKSYGTDQCGFCVGGKVSYVDYTLFDTLDVFLVLSPTCLNNEEFPTLDGFYKKFQARPKLAEYRKTEAFKQKMLNGNGKV